MPLPTGADPLAIPPAGTLQAWADGSRDLVLVADAQCRVVWCNPRLERLLARSSISLCQQALATLLPLAAADRPRWQAACEQLARGEAFAELEVELELPPGKTSGDDRSWLRIAARRIGPGADGGDSHWLCVLTDTSEVKRLERRTHKLQELLSLGGSFDRLGVWERDLRTGGGHWDAKVFRLYGFDPAAGVPELGLAVSRIHPEDRAQFAFGSLTPQPGHYDRRYRLVLPDGSIRWVHSQWEVIAAADGSAERAVGIVLDDTAAYDLAQALGSASAQLELAIELGNIALWRHDLRTDWVAYNKRAHQVFGLPQGSDGISLAAFRARIHPEDAASVAAKAASALGSEQPTDIEARFKGNDGEWRTVMTRRVVERSADGAPVAFVGVALDVTRQAEERRRATELLHHMEAAAAAAGVGIWSTDEHSGKGQWNAPMFTLVGRPVTPIPPSRDEWLADIIHPADRERLLAARAAFQSAPRGVGELTYRVRLPGGATRWLEDRVRRELLDGRATLFGVTLDVTRRKQAEEALRSADERAALATRSAGIGTWEMSLVDADERWDAQMFRLRGIAVRDRPPSREERLAMLHPDDRALVFDSRADAKTHAGVARYEFRVRWPDASERWIASRSMAVLDDTGRPIRRVGVNWDITESKLAEAARQESALAQQESRAKSLFLSRVSHELRTPLNAVLGFTQLMQTGDSLPTADKARLTLVRTAGEHLLALINDMLDLTALDTGEMKLDPQPVPIAELVAETLPLVEPMATQHRVALLTGGLEGIVLADRTRLRQVLINLLTNAIKYNRPQGSVTLGTRHAGQHPTIEVSDTGRGLTQDQLTHLFEPFNRLGAEGDSVEGSGIGLVIVKTLVERMGGKVAVSSEPGRGTCFGVTLPGATWAGAGNEPARAPTGADSQAPAGAGRERTRAAQGRLLYIEDNAVNVLLVRELVAQRPGVEMLSAADGSQGVALALAHRPELVLIDMQLPDFDGFEVLRRVRAAPNGAALRCIALSANAMPQDIERALAAGFADYWTKPIDFKRFLAGLDAAFAVAPQAG